MAAMGRAEKCAIQIRLERGPCHTSALECEEECVNAKDKNAGPE